MKGIKSKDPEVRFYSAEALAYLDRREAAEPLGQIARDAAGLPRVCADGAERHAGLRGLRATSRLLSVPSAETRYGAFRACGR